MSPSCPGSGAAGLPIRKASRQPRTRTLQTSAEANRSIEPCRSADRARREACLAAGGKDELPSPGNGMPRDFSRHIFHAALAGRVKPLPLACRH